VSKLIRLKHWYDPSAYDDLTAGGLVEKGIGRLVDELHRAGVLDAYAVARIAGVDQLDVSEAPA
jgi:hypothetical protein